MSRINIDQKIEENSENKFNLSRKIEDGFLKKGDPIILKGKECIIERVRVVTKHKNTYIKITGIVKKTNEEVMELILQTPYKLDRSVSSPI